MDGSTGSKRGGRREAVAVFDDVGAFERAVEELLAAGFPRDSLSMLAGAATVEKKLGHKFRRVEELEDDPEAPRTAFVSLRELTERETTVWNSVTILPTLIAAGTVVATAGPLAAVIIGTAVTGAALATVLTHWMDDRQARWLEEQLERGGILLWVTTATPEQEAAALEILRRHAAHDVHVHELSADEDPPRSGSGSANSATSGA